jgi:3-dehydroquinate synthase
MATAGELLHAAPPHTYLQKFTVRYEYPVLFTRDVFSPANPIFVETLARLESNYRHNVMVFIDDGLATVEGLPSRITAYAAVPQQEMELVAPPEIIPGGDRGKNHSALVERLQRRLVELALDRHARGVLPARYRTTSLAPAIARELQWVPQRFPA